MKKCYSNSLSLINSKCPGLHKYKQLVSNKLKGLKVTKEDQRSIDSMVDGSYQISYAVKEVIFSYWLRTDGWTDRQTDGQMDICNSRAAFGTEKQFVLFHFTSSALLG